MADLASRTTPFLAARIKPAISSAKAAITSADADTISVHAAGREFKCDVQLWGSDQEQAWHALGEPLVATVLTGVSATLIAYGCAGAGKTYTVGGHGIDAPGLAPRCLYALCEAANKDDSGLQLEMSMLEVYMDRAYDLLAPRSAEHPRVPLQMTAPRNGTTVWWAAAGGTAAADDEPASPAAVAAEGCWHAVNSFAQAEALRQLGEAQRSVRPTALHERTSRGHCLLYVRLTKVGAAKGDEEVAEEWQCKLCLASLCGVERVEANGALSAPALREALNLSGSLSALGGMLPLLTRRDAHLHQQRLSYATPLLQLLRETLEGNAALIVCAILSPSESLAAESLSTLRFLTAIKNLPLNPQQRTSDVRVAMRTAAERVGALRVDQDAGSADVDALLTPAVNELHALRSLVAEEKRDWSAKLRSSALKVRKVALSVRHAGLPTASLLEAFGWSADIADLRWHTNDASEYVKEGAGAPTSPSNEYLHTAHLLDLPAAASGGPTIRLPLPLPGHRKWIRGETPVTEIRSSSLLPTGGPPSPAASLHGVEDESLRVFGLGVGDPHAVLAVSSESGAVQLEVLEEKHTCVLNGDLLQPGNAFTLHHGDRLFIGGERLFLVSLWKPLHDGSHEAAAAAAAAAGHGSVVISSHDPPVGGWTAHHEPSSPNATDIAVGSKGGFGGRGGFGDVSSGGSGGNGALAFRLEAESLLRRAEAELLDATGIRFHEMHRLRRAGQMLRSTWRRAAGSLLTTAEAEVATERPPPAMMTRMDTGVEVASAVSSTSPAIEPLGGPLWKGGGGSPLPILHADGALRMIDAACSARPIEDVALEEIPKLHNIIAKSEEEAAGLKLELDLAKAEAAEVAADNLRVREALDESRERLSEMAEELAVTKAELRARELLELQKQSKQRSPQRDHGLTFLGDTRPTTNGKQPAGILDSLFGCAGGRAADPDPQPKAYAVTLKSLPAPVVRELSPPPPPPEPPPRSRKPHRPPIEAGPSAFEASLLSPRVDDDAFGIDDRPPSPGLTPPPRAWKASPRSSSKPRERGERKPRLERKSAKPRRHKQSGHGKRTSFGSQSGGEDANLVGRVLPTDDSLSPPNGKRLLPDGMAWRSGPYDTSGRL